MDEEFEQDNVLDDMPVMCSRYQVNHAIKDDQSVSKMLTNTTKTIIHNPNIDTKGNAANISYPYSYQNQNKYRHFMMKHKHRNEKKEIFTILREQLQDKIKKKQVPYQTVNSLSDKMSSQVMIVRFIYRQDNNKMIVEDEQSSQIMVIKVGIVWVGLICAVEASFVDGAYNLAKIVDLNQPSIKKIVNVHSPLKSYNLCALKGPFMEVSSGSQKGMCILRQHLKRMRAEGVPVNALVIFGPLLSVNNQIVRNFQLERTYEQQMEQIVRTLETSFEGIELFLIPSVSDVTVLHPIPQICYNIKPNSASCLSNPGHLLLESSPKVEINCINQNIIKFIENNKAGKSIEMGQEILSTYFKQSFYLTNTQEGLLDQTNLPVLYNQGHFGDIVLTTSNDTPYAKQCDDKLFVSCGTLGMEGSTMGDYYITLLQIFQGEGPACLRTKVTAYSINPNM